MKDRNSICYVVVVLLLLGTAVENAAYGRGPAYARDAAIPDGVLLFSIERRPAKYALPESHKPAPAPALSLVLRASGLSLENPRGGIEMGMAEHTLSLEGDEDSIDLGGERNEMGFSPALTLRFAF